MTDLPYDAATLAFYESEAAAYARRARGEPSRRLNAFAALLPPGAAVLELGCGGGQDAEALIARGLDVTATDGSAALAKEAERRLGRPVKQLRFDELRDVGTYDGVWANASLLHAPAAALPGVLGSIHRALKPGGLFYASYKAGGGGDRDALGRYFNFPARADLERAYLAAGAWETLGLEESDGGGYDGVARTWLHCLMRKPRAPSTR
jgi:SAM-dependent methyltransferase